MTKGIKTFRIYGNDVEMWLKQNNGDYTGDCVEGCLLDNFMVQTPYGYAFFKEIALNCWTSCYEVYYGFDRKNHVAWNDIYNEVWNMWYDFEAKAEAEA